MPARVNKIIICGFDFRKTEALARRMEKIYGMRECSIVYVPDGNYREDRMTAHVISSGGGDNIFRYIRKHEADVIYSGSVYDAYRNFPWINSRGRIMVEDGDSAGEAPGFPDGMAEEYLKVQVEMGYVQTFIHCKSILADV